MTILQKIWFSYSKISQIQFSPFSSFDCENFKTGPKTYEH